MKVSMRLITRTSEKFPLKPGDESRAKVLLTFPGGVKVEPLVDVVAVRNGDGVNIEIVTVAFSPNSQQVMFDKIAEAKIQLDDVEKKKLLGKIHKELTKRMGLPVKVRV